MIRILDSSSESKFLVVFSVYSGLMFGLICSPEENRPERRWEFTDEIRCKNDYKDPVLLCVQAAWFFLMLSLFIYLGRTQEVYIQTEY